jgi:hypothetical protein
MIILFIFFICEKKKKDARGKKIYLNINNVK